MAATTKPFAALVRSSDRVAERQRDGTYHGDEDQVADIERYARNRMRVELLPPELDVSGGLPVDQRPSLKAAIEGVERGDYAGIVTANLKRLTRSRSGIDIWTRVEAAGGHVHCAAENIDTSTPSGRFVRDIFLADAVRERDEHSDRHAKRRAGTVEAGIWRQRQLPRGYAFKGPASDDGKYRGVARRLVPGPDAEQVRQAFRDRAAGTPIVTIARRLSMTPSGVRQLLQNRVYVGELRDGSNVKLGAHEPLVSVELFDAAQARQPRPPRSVSDGPALLAGLVRCAGCGHVMSRKRTKQLVYACPVHHSGQRCPAPAAITTAVVEAYVELIALAELARLDVTAREGDRLAAAQQRVENAERELAAFLAGVAAAELEPHQFADGARTRREAIVRAKDVLRAERSRSTVLPAAMSGADAWNTLDTAERNGQLRGLLAAVIVRRAGGRGARVPVADRVRVVRFGADVTLAGGGHGTAAGLVPVWPDVNKPDVLGVPSGKDRS